MPTISDASEALQLLKNHLQSRLNADYIDVFASYGGADVVTLDEEESAAQSAGHPYLKLKVNSDAKSSYGSGARPARDAVIAGEVRANGFSGAGLGAANPTGSDTLLVRSVLEICEADYQSLADIGLLLFEARAGAEKIEASDEDEVGEHVNPITFNFTYKVK